MLRSCYADAGETEFRSHPLTDLRRLIWPHDCKKDWDCSEFGKLPKPACESVSAMMTAVCNLTPDEIKTLVEQTYFLGWYKNKTNGAIEFSPLVTPEATPAPTLSAASGSSPMWALALAAFLFSAVPAVYPNA